MDFMLRLKLLMLLEPSKVIGLCSVGLSALALVIVLIVKNLKKAAASASNHSAEDGKQEQMNQPKAQMPSPRAAAASSSGYHPVKYASAAMPVMQQDPRTVLMSYSTLVLRDSACRGKCYRADLRQPVTIGRSSNNTITIADESVSRLHLRVYRDGGAVMVENLSSMNGTMLEGIRLAGARELRTGSILQLGRICLTAEID